ncbi:protocadherin-9 [Elysia marginata]|uniref:Protocadherin-9 n=1 Tax=Elysia marginata TaxID=1093978 RepID=A0AAV4JKZ7_9GAST|nr:protocadherin-9 [Elysia marginata]
MNSKFSSLLPFGKLRWRCSQRMTANRGTCFFLLSVLLPQVALSQDRTYNFKEQEPEGSFVGNIARDLNLEAIISDAIFQSLQYSILVYKDGDYFRIDPVNSDLFTRGVLDREEICPYDSQCVLELRVGARSETDLQKYSIVVNLLDINDNSPRFNQTTFTQPIPESVQVGKKYPLPGALDDDRGPGNSIQSYSIRPFNGLPNDGTFEVEFSQKLDGTSDVSLVVRRSLDRETRDNYNLVLTAVDGGSDPSPREGSMSIIVQVLDDNDHTPMFDQARYSVQVGENTVSGAVIITLTATDGDIGPNAALQYRLSVHQDASVARQFAVDRVTGELTARVALTSGSYTIIVEAVDGGSRQRVNQTVVEVTVIDTENNPPLITVDPLNEGSPWALISEEAKVDDLVAHVTVFDPDSGPNGAVLCYSQSAFFDLHPQEDNDYLVVVAKPLDREVTPEFRVTLFCEDSGSPKLNDTQVFDVLVKDENDNPPILRDGGDVTVQFPENNTINDVVTLIEATDADSGENAALRFSLLDNSGGFFQIPQGSNVLLCSRVLDRETNDSHVVKVLVQDGGDPPKSATGTVTISLQDVNDVAPKFFQASDADEGRNGEVRYILARQNSSLFNLDPVLGDLVTLRELTTKDVGVYNLTVTASDAGAAPLSTTKKFSVVVKVDPGMKAVKGDDNNAAIAIGLVCGTALLAAAVIAVVCYVKRRDKSTSGKGKPLRYLDTAVENNSSSPRILDVTQLEGLNHYGENKQEPNNNITFSNGTEPYAKYSVPKLSVGYPGVSCSKVVTNDDQKLGSSNRRDERQNKALQDRT